MGPGKHAFSQCVGFWSEVFRGGLPATHSSTVEQVSPLERPRSPAQRRMPLPAQASKAWRRSAPTGCPIIDANCSAAFVDAVEFVALVPLSLEAPGVGGGCQSPPAWRPPFRKKGRRDGTLPVPEPLLRHSCRHRLRCRL